MNNTKSYNLDGKFLPSLCSCILAATVMLLVLGCSRSSSPSRAIGATALCGSLDKPEPGIQGDVSTTTVNCGLTLLSEVAPGGSVAGSDHCGYVRKPGTLPYTGADIYAFDLTDPRNPVQTDQLPSVGGSESMRGKTVDGRAILVSGRAVYDVSDCEKLATKGEIQWPSAAAAASLYLAAMTSHEISISHNAKRVYTGVGFGVADISNLENPETWTVHNWACEIARQSGYLSVDPGNCTGPLQADVPPCPANPGLSPCQYSHASDDNLDGTVWYGANQNGGLVEPEPATARMVDVSDSQSIKLLDTLPQFPGHSMNWWRDNHDKEFIIGANENPFYPRPDTCQSYPRPTALGNNLEAYIVEVTDKKFHKENFETYRKNPQLTMAINRPENCEASKASGAQAGLSEYSVFNKKYPDGHTVAFVMMEFAGPSTGGAGLRVFDLSDGYHLKEVAYYNENTGYVHSAQFYFSEARGYILASGTNGMQTLLVQPQVIKALGLPQPTDPAYPYTAH